MPVYIPDQLVPSLKNQLLGGIFSAIAYGIVIVLSGNCFHLLLNKRGIYSNRKRILLLIYVAVMLLCSTWTLIQWMFLFMQFITIQGVLVLPRYFLSLSISIPLVVWGADGFMVRVSILYRNKDLQYNYRYGVVLCCIRACLNVSGL
jgi:hypothetical protein